MKNCRNSSVPVAEAISGRIRPDIGVEQAEIGDDLVGRIDAHLDRQHQRDEDDPERRLPEREAEIDDRVGREDRDQDLADRDAHRHDERVQHHRADRLAGRARRADEDRAVVVLVRLVAGNERHVAVADGRGVEGRGDDRQIDRERDDEDAERQGRDRRRGFRSAGSRPSVLHLALDDSGTGRR